MVERPKYFTCARAYPDKPPARVGDVWRPRVRPDCLRRVGWGKHYILPCGGISVCQSCEKYKPKGVNGDG